jgi:hypothetical protein
MLYMNIYTFDKIEYKCIRIPTVNSTNVIDQLNELGKSGWEYIYHDNQNNYFLKRVLKSKISKI